MSDTPAKRWAAALIRVMQQRQVPVKGLAAATGTGMSSVSQLRTGDYLPSMAKAAQIADALAAPELVKLCADLRRRRCEVCDREFIEDHNGGTAQRWCDPACKEVGRKRIKAANDRAFVTRRHDLWKRRYVAAQSAIERMCWSCEPEGACRQPDCALRPRSPLPIVGSSDVPLAASGSVRLTPGSVLRVELTKKRKAAWAKRARARVA